jgi:hypothetical protein
MSSQASRRSRDARFESMKRQADRAETLKQERDDAMAALVQAKALLDAGDAEGARNALDVGGAIEPLPASAIDLIGFAADFNALCLKRKVRAAWFTTTPLGDQTVSISTGGEANHNALLDRALDRYANRPDGDVELVAPPMDEATKAHLRGILTPDEVRAAFPEGPTGNPPLPFPIPGLNTPITEDEKRALDVALHRSPPGVEDGRGLDGRAP